MTIDFPDSDPRGTQLILILERAKHERYLSNEVARLLEREFNRVADLILSPKFRTLTLRQRQRTLQLFREIDRRLTSGYRDVTTLVLREMRGYAILEAEISRLQVTSTLAAGGGEVSISLGVALPKAYLQSIATLPVQGLHIGEWFDAQARTMRLETRRIIQQGLVEGKGPAEIARRVIADARTPGATVSKRARNEATAITRTTVNAVQNDATRQSYRQLPASVSDSYRWVSVRDARLTPICAALDGRVWRYDDPAGRVPPAHINALASGTLIQTNHGDIPVECVAPGMLALTHAGRYMPVTAVMDADRDARRIREIVTDSGRSLRVTDDHPVLTRDGWKRAQDVEIGDQLFEHDEQRSQLDPSTRPAAVEQAVLTDAHDRPSSFDEELIAYRILRAPARVAAPVDFKDDHRHRERHVNDVRPDGMLGDEISVTADERQQHQALVERGIPLVALRARDGEPFRHTGEAAGVACLHAFAGPLRVPRGKHRHSSSPVRFTTGAHDRLAGHARALTLSAHGDAVALTPPIQATGSPSAVAFDRTEGFAAVPVPRLDERPNVVSISQINHTAIWRATTVKSNAEVADDSPLLWNLSVQDDETYVADGIVVHNCRSTTLAVIKGAEVSEAEQKSQPLTMQSMGAWLTAQPVTTQNQILGATRAQLFRDGRMKLADAIDQDNRVLTLAQLRATLGLDQPAAK